MPIGVDDFKAIHERNLYYVDKSMLIKDILDDGAEVNLIARPRRFGKTLNLSMLRYFFEKTEENHGALFQDLEIWYQGERYQREQGKYPVIALTLKSLKMNTWKSNYSRLCTLLATEIERHGYLYEKNDLSSNDKYIVSRILDRTADESEYGGSIELLSRLLHAYHGEKVIILVDEYDTLLNEAYIHGFYDEAAAFLRLLLGEAFKNNVHLRKGVMTGIFRVAKESIFSGLNNLKVSTIIQDDYREYFGFTELEVQKILEDFGLREQVAEVTKWYNGYRFGEEVPLTIYNPWSIVQYSDQRKLVSYWVNTSDNLIVRKLVTEGSGEIQQQVADLLKRQAIGPVRIDDTIVYREVDRSPDTIWSFLLMSGYLKTVTLERHTEGMLRGLFGTLTIPNEEVYDFFAEMLSSWFSDTVKGGSTTKLLQALTDGDIATFSGMLQETVLHTFSYHDVSDDRSESFYHAFVLGILVYLDKEYEVISNRESGYGRHDVMIVPRERKKGRKGIILEFKRADAIREESLDEALDAALLQIDEKRYEAELHARGIQGIVKLGIAFKGKRVKVKGREQGEK
ncbi:MULTISPECIES: AAA family ATPase [unclassified Cohnella]|uniref:AAA family ATPase n=1 Tax=unclassified Cohnella TaxID=2636738 RepID=UPI001E4B57B4|nr:MULTISPECIES: AAA family ATPase [unclassified Cohnella]